MNNAYDKDTTDAKHQDMENQIQQIHSMVQKVQDNTPSIQRFDALENQVHETNGKVKEVKKWKEQVMGGVKVLSFLLGGGALLTAISIVIQFL